MARRAKKTTAKKTTAKKTTAKKTKRITRYSHDDATDPRTPETGHTSLLPGDEQVVSLPMDNGWTEAIDVGKLDDADTPIIIDLDPVLDPVLFWAGKRNRRDVPVLPLQRNEVISESRIARIVERARDAAQQGEPKQGSLFAELEKTLRESERDKRVEFYTHDEGWKNKLICGDSLPVMESLLHYEGLRGRVQMIYIDPPYGINYSSNFQQRIDTTKNDEKDRGDDVLTIKAFNDTWSLGIHSYLSYLQERLYLCRELLADSGSIVVQIGSEHLQRVAMLLDEVFGSRNRCATIGFVKSSGRTSELLGSQFDFLLWYARSKDQVKFHRVFYPKVLGTEGTTQYVHVEEPSGNIRRLTADEMANPEQLPAGSHVLALDNLSSQTGGESISFEYEYEGETFKPPGKRGWRTTKQGLDRLAQLNRLQPVGKSLMYRLYIDDFPLSPVGTYWRDTMMTGFTEPRVFVVQTSIKVLKRCIAMTTDPGDLVFDPTCGSGTTAHAAELLGRRWIACDTSRVAINIARQRLLSAVFEHYQTKNGNPSSGFSFTTVERKTLKSIAYDLEPESVELVDQPRVDPNALRVTGPFEAMTMGRYSLEDWKGFVFSEEGEEGRLQDYVSVICRLYRKDAALLPSAGVVHAVVEAETERFTVSVGPISGRVTARQIHDAAQETSASGMREVHVLGWAFEPNVGEIKQRAEDYHKVQVRLVMIRPDILAEGLKVTKPETLFSPLALPDIDVYSGQSDYRVLLKGVALFDRKERATRYMAADSGYIAAWYLDEDYDGDCFVDCQMFFDFKKKPAIESTLGIKVDPDEWTLRLESDLFTAGKYHRIAVKVVDVYGNESTVVKDLSG